MSNITLCYPLPPKIDHNCMLWLFYSWLKRKINEIIQKRKLPEFPHIHGEDLASVEWLWSRCPCPPSSTSGSTAETRSCCWRFWHSSVWVGGFGISISETIPEFRSRASTFQRSAVSGSVGRCLEAADDFGLVWPVAVAVGDGLDVAAFHEPHCWMGDGNKD